jgi:hypothetical protein
MDRSVGSRTPLLGHSELPSGYPSLLGAAKKAQNFWPA